MKKTKTKEAAPSKFVIVRTKLTGVVCGYLESIDSNGVKLTEVRQIWRWRGANTATALAAVGASMTDWTKIDKPCPAMFIVAEPGMAILECTPEAEANLRQSRWLS